MQKRIVTVGECMVELAPAGGGLLRQGFAGDTFNMAWYLRRLLPADWAVDYLTCVGQDAISDAMVGFMQAADIGTGAVGRTEGATVGLYLISVTNGERSFSYWRGQSAARQLADDPDRLLSGLESAGVIVFSGVTLAILEPAHREALLHALSTARAAGACVVFDPNMRARLWPDARTMQDAVRDAIAHTDIVLPSFDEEQAVFGDPNPDATVARYRAWGASVVVVKNGDGAMFGWENTGVTYQPPAITPVDTTAAGDSFNAGFLAARLQGAPLADAMAQGAALAGRVILQPGALVLF